MNKYKSIYTEELLNAEREQIKKVLSGEGTEAEKAAIIRGIMAFTDNLISGEEEQ